MLLLDKVLFRRGLRSLPLRATLPSRRRRRRRLVQFARPTKRRPPSNRIFYPRAMDFVEWNHRSGPILEFSSFDWGESFYEGEISSSFG